jgi:hypothetical protein
MQTKEKLTRPDTVAVVVPIAGTIRPKSRDINQQKDS